MTDKQLKNLKDTLWETADQLRANSGLKSTEYAEPILGLIFLRFADVKYSKFEKEITAEYEKTKGSRMERPLHEIAIEKCGFYLPQEARYDWLLNLPESENLAQKVKEAVVGWQNDPQPKERVKSEIVSVLNQFLPESYDRALFWDKSTLIFEHIVDQAVTGYNWVA